MNKLGFKMKVLLMLGTALVALLFMAITALLQERSLIIESRREQLATVCNRRTASWQPSRPRQPAVP